MSHIHAGEPRSLQRNSSSLVDSWGTSRPVGSWCIQSLRISNTRADPRTCHTRQFPDSAFLHAAPNPSQIWRGKKFQYVDLFPAMQESIHTHFLLFSNYFLNIRLVRTCHAPATFANLSYPATPASCILSCHAQPIAILRRQKVSVRYVASSRARIKS